MTEKEKKERGEISRREFLKDAGLVVGGAAIGSTVLLAACAGEETTETVTATQTTTQTMTQTATQTETATQTSTVTTTAPGETSTVTTTAPGETSTVTTTKTVEVEVPVTFPASQGYIVVDSKKCSGCTSCMLACSLVHEGKEDLSLARIQIVADPHARFPNDLQINQCRQCVDPLCVKVCPTGACHVDTANGNVRVIDESKCIGCKLCIQACPFVPHRTIWNHEKDVAMKCDLCLDTPFWNGTGGPGGTQACVDICPMEAIKFVSTVPSQLDTDGYNVNLRSANWPYDQG